MLHQMNVKQSFADRLIVQRRGIRLERPPVLGVGPLLVRVQLVEIGHQLLIRPRFAQVSEFYALARADVAHCAQPARIMCRVCRF